LYFMDPKCIMTNTQDSPGLSATNSKPLPHGLMSLRDMINCSVLGLGPLCADLMLLDVTTEQFRAPSPEALVTDEFCDRLRKMIEIASHLADDFEWQAVHDRIQIITARLDGKRGRFTNQLMATECRVLRETIDSGLKWQLIYRYPNDKRYLLENWKEHWASVRAKFPSAEIDILAAVDLWALGHSTASVFHFMRVLEHGLRALANDVGRSFDIQNWQNIIDQIESEVRNLGKTLPASPDKTERLRFLSEAAKEFSYFKDGWRNHVSHGRGVYDEHQARSIMEHVKAFMTVLASKLREH
jgi:hypothetical protein